MESEAGYRDLVQGLGSKLAKKDRGYKLTYRVSVGKSKDVSRELKKNKQFLFAYINFQSLEGKWKSRARKQFGRTRE